jgi:TonB family protein
MQQLYFGLALLACLPATEAWAAPGLPVALFPVDACAGFYPSALASAHVGGQATLTYEIVPNGSTQKILVIKSSGNADLDEAARKYVGSLRFRTLQAVAWRAHIVWAFGPSGLVSSVDVPHWCDNYYPPAELNQGITGTTVLAFTVKSDGYIDDIKVTTSSGNANLDTAAVTCARRWHYRPSTVDGKPVDAPWQAQVVWQVPLPPPK